MNLQESLTALGLTKHEIAIYRMLLEIGSTQAGPLVKKTRLHRMFVYNALDSLTDKGLVSITHKKRIKIFQANDPDILLTNAEKVRTIAQEAIPQLRKLQQQKGNLVNVQTFTGHQGLQTALTLVIESAAKHTPREILILGGASAEEFYYGVADWYPKYAELLKQHRVKKKLLAPSTTTKGFEPFRKEKNTKLRVIARGLSSPTYTRITPDLVSIEIYRPQIVVIQIHNPAIATSYSDSFNLLWKAGTKK